MVKRPAEFWKPAGIQTSDLIWQEDYIVKMNQKDISIAVVGTTSSGKSSFINTLCGRYILPVGVQETTLYITELIHIPTNLIVCIENKAISFDKRYFSTDSEARKYIYDLIEEFENSSNQFHKMTTTRVQLSFISDFLNIFSYNQDEKNISLRILDLPGYNHDGDERNWELILKGIENAFIIILLFNAEETDSVKEDQFLRKILKHLYKKGKSWKDIYFVLNRCDALFRDNPDKSVLTEKQHTLQNRIETIINDVFEKKDNSNSKPVIHPLSALPVMYGQVLFWNFHRLAREERTNLISQSCLLTNQFLSDDICDSFPRSARNWTYHHIQMYRNEILTSCFYDSFLVSFESHVKHLLKK